MDALLEPSPQPCGIPTHPSPQFVGRMDALPEPEPQFARYASERQPQPRDIPMRCCPQFVGRMDALPEPQLQPRGIPDATPAALGKCAGPFPAANCGG